MNVYILTIIYWIHLLSTVLWFGGMITNIFVTMPCAMKTLDPPLVGKLLGAIMKKFRVIVYLSMILLGITGGIMNIVNKNYSGLMVLDNQWAGATFVKHILVVFMIILAVFAFEVLGKKAGKLAAKGPSPELGKLQSTQKIVGLISAVCAMGILFLTAMMNAYSSM